MYIDIFNTKNKYDIIYADPPWEYRQLGDDKRRIELFARQKANGWDCWGDEAENN